MLAFAVPQQPLHAQPPAIPLVRHGFLAASLRNNACAVGPKPSTNPTTSLWFIALLMVLVNVWCLSLAVCVAAWAADKPFPQMQGLRSQ
jgi:hypothetical protein